MRASRLITIGGIGLLALGCGGQNPAGSTASAGQNADGTTTQQVNSRPVVFRLSATAGGISEVVNNIPNLTVVSRDRNVLKAEYQAGFVQGHLQGNAIRDARDNAWVGLNGWTEEPWVPADEVTWANSILAQNFDGFLSYLRTTPDRKAAHGLERLLFRMLGIYHGATRARPASLDFSGRFLPDASYFRPEELVAGYATPDLTFMDVYFVNAMMDMMDVLSNLPAPEPSEQAAGSKAALRATPARSWAGHPLWKNVNPLRCSAFLRRAHNGELILAHNTWTWFVTGRTTSMTIDVNGERMTANAASAGQLASGTDFGFNSKGLLFNETTNSYHQTQVKPEGLFIFWRAALAENQAGSLDEFFHDISLDNTGTYMNVYMVADANTGEMGLVDMSYRSFVFLRSDGGPYTVTTLPAGQDTGYDTTMVDPDFILGYNYPPTALVRSELTPADPPWENRIAELGLLVPQVEDVEDAKAVITSTVPDVRGAIYSRFDLVDSDGNPIGPHPEYGAVEFGAVDAKVVSASMVRRAQRLEGILDVDSPARGFWMKWGTPHDLAGAPFTWSQSAYADWPHPGIPDAMDGTFTYVKPHLR